MDNITTLDPKQLSIPVLHRHLLAAVAPRPIALASTIDKQGNVNLSPFSFFNVFSANPPIMIFSPARRGRENTTKHTYENILEVPEVVINVVNFSMVHQVSLASAEYPTSINEFHKAGFGEVASIKIKPPRVGKSPVSFECTVEKVIPLGTAGGAGNLIIARVELIHIHSQYLNKEGNLDTTALDLVGRMGGNWYSRTYKECLFQVPKPEKNPVLGIDQLPASIRNSRILTGNNLGMLGNINHFPNTQAVLEWKNSIEISTLLEHSEAGEKLHVLAQKMLELGQIQQALLTLMVADGID